MGTQVSGSMNTFLAQGGYASMTGAGSLDGDETSAGGERLLAQIASRGFLEAGKDSKVWFAIPERVKVMIREHADDGDSIIAAIESVMDSINEFLAREDVSDELKLKFLRTFVSAPSGGVHDAANSDSGEAHTHLGSLLAEVMVGAPDTMAELFEEDVFGGDATELDDIGAITRAFENAKDDWMEKNKVDVEEDTTMAWMATQTLDAESRLSRMRNMTVRERVEEAERFNAELDQRIHQNKLNEAAKLGAEEA